MFSNLCVLLVCGLVFAPTHGEETARKAGNVIPQEEWNEESLKEFFKSKKADPDGVSMEEAKAEIDYLNRIYAKHVRDNNCGAIINLYDPNIMMIDSEGTIMKGMEAIQFTMTALENVGTLNMTSLAVSPLGKDARFVFQHAYAVAYDKEGSFLYKGGSFVIWKRHHHGLKIHLEVYDLESQTY